MLCIHKIWRFSEEIIAYEYLKLIYLNGSLLLLLKKFKHKA